MTDPYNPVMATGAVNPSLEGGPGSDDTQGATPKAAGDDDVVLYPLSAKEAVKLKERMKTSERFRDMEFKTHYDNSRNLYKGDQWSSKNTSDEARCTINYIHPNIHVKVATVCFSYPEIDLTPLNEQSQDKATVATAACKYMWKMAHCQRETKRAYQDKETFGFGVVYNGWLFRTKDGFIREDGREDVAGEGQGDPLDFGAMAERVSAGLEPLDQIQADDVIEDRFFCKRLNPFNFLIDPEADWVLEDAEYCGYVEMVPLNTLKQDPRLKNVKQLQGSSATLAGYTTEKQKENSSDIKRVKVFHYYEKARQLHVMFCDEHDKPLISNKWTWEHGRYPFRAIHSRKLQDDFYGYTPVEMLEPMQTEINITRSMLKNHLRRFTRKFQAARGLLDNNAKKALKSAMDGALVEHNGGSGTQVVFPIDHSPIAPEAYKSDEWAIRDMRVVSGLDEYEMNQVGQTRRTAQEVQQIRQAGGARAQEDAQQYEMLCAEVLQDCLDWMMQYATRAVSIPIYGPQDQIMEWQSFTADDIKGEYLVDVYVGSTLPHNSLEKQQMYTFLLQTMAPYAEMQDPTTGQPMVNIKQLLKSLLSCYPDIRNVDQILAPDQPPQQPQMPMPMQGQPPQGGPPPQQGIDPSSISQLASIIGAQNGLQGQGGMPL